MSRRVFKKRPKGFFGVPRHAIERPIPLETASSKKLALSPEYASTRPPQPSTSSPGESYHYVGQMKGYRLVSCERFSQAVSKIGLCSVCRSPLTLREDLVSRRGWYQS